MLVLLKTSIEVTARWVNALAANDTTLNDLVLVDLYGNPCCSRCFDTAAFLKSPTIDRVPALLSANDPAPPKPSAAEQAKLRRQEKLLGPAAVKLGPAVNELRNRLKKAGFESPAKTANDNMPSPSSPKKEPTNGSSEDQEQKRPWKMPIADKLERSQPVASSAASARVADRSNKLLVAESVIEYKAPARPLLGPRTTSFVPPKWLANQLETSSKQSIPAPSLDGKLGPGGAKAPPMLRSLSDLPPIRSKPSEAPASWQRHRLTRSVAGLPNANTILSPPVANTEAVPPTSPVLAQIAIFETASGQRSPAAGPVTGWKRPERTGRSQSMFAIPTLTQLKDGASSRPLVAPVSGEQGRPAPRGPPRPPVPEEGCPTRASVRPRSAGKAPVVEQAAAPSPSSPTKASASESLPASSVLSADSRCSGCQLRLFSIGDIKASENSKIITLPDTGAKYHSRCFVCGTCKKAFEDGVFVELDDGKKVHEKVSSISRQKRERRADVFMQCAPPLQPAVITMTLPMGAGSKPEPSKPKVEGQKVFRSSPSINALQKQQSAVQVTPLSPSKIQIKVKPTAGPTKLSKASEVFAGGRPSSANQNLGGMYVCAGCGENATMAETTRRLNALAEVVSHRLMDAFTVGPVGTRFHHRCLKCSCGKKLDSGAKSLEVPGETGETRRRFACRDCIDKDRLAKRSLSSVTGLNALRGRI